MSSTSDSPSFTVPADQSSGNTPSDDVTTTTDDTSTTGVVDGSTTASDIDRDYLNRWTFGTMNNGKQDPVIDLTTAPVDTVVPTDVSPEIGDDASTAALPLTDILDISQAKTQVTTTVVTPDVTVSDQTITPDTQVSQVNDTTTVADVPVSDATSDAATVTKTYSSEAVAATVSDDTDKKKKKKKGKKDKKKKDKKKKNKRSQISPNMTFAEIRGNLVWNFFRQWMMMISNPDTQVSQVNDTTTVADVPVSDATSDAATVTKTYSSEAVAATVSDDTDKKKKKKKGKKDKKKKDKKKKKKGKKKK